MSATLEAVDDINDAFAVAGCQLGQAFTGYTDSVETTRAYLGVKGPDGARIARGAEETLIWFTPQGLLASSEVEVVATQGALNTASFTAACGTSEDDALDEGEEPLVFSYELAVEAVEVGPEALVLRSDGLLSDLVQLEVVEAATLRAESTAVPPNPEAEPTAERLSSVCATPLDAEGGALYAADSIRWRLVSGEATLSGGVLGLDLAAPLTGRCINVSSASEEPIVVEAAFLELVAEVEVEFE